jgi:hypothetical protein
MPRIPLAKLQDGMILIRPVLSPSGALLVKDGVAVTGEIRGKLVAGGIRHVHVAAGPDDGRLREELSALEGRFSKSENIQPMRLLQELVREHLEELYR